MASLVFKGTVSSLPYISNPLATYTQQVMCHQRSRKVESFRGFRRRQWCIDRYLCTEHGTNVFLRTANTKALELDYKIVSRGTLNEEVDWGKSFPVVPPAIFIFSTVPQVCINVA
jgi:hypothetical protein